MILFSSQQGSSHNDYRHLVRGVAFFLISSLSIALGAITVLHTGITVLFLVSFVLVCVLVLARYFIQSSITPSAATIPALAAEEPRLPLEALARTLFLASLLTSGVLTFRPAAGFTLSDNISLLALGALLLSQLIERKPRRQSISTLLLIGLLLYATGASTSSIFSPLPIESMFYLFKFLYLMVGWIWLATATIRTLRDLENAIVAWLVGMAFSASCAAIQMWAGGQFWLSTDAVYGRMTGLAEHPNDLGAQCAIALPVSMTLFAFAQNSLRTRMITYLVTPLLVVGLVLSSSVTSLVAAALAPMLLFAYFPYFRLSHLFVAFFVVLVSVTLLMSGGNNKNFILTRVSSTVDTTGEYCTMCSRAETSALALAAIAKQPFIGRGLDSVGSKTSDGLQVHNIMLKSWFEAGILGVLGMLSIMLSIYTTGVSALRSSQHAILRAVILSLLASFSVVVVISTNQPLLYQRYAWIPAGLVLVTASIVERIPLRPAAHDTPSVPCHAA